MSSRGTDSNSSQSSSHLNIEQQLRPAVHSEMDDVSNDDGDFIDSEEDKGEVLLYSYQEELESLCGPQVHPEVLSILSEVINWYQMSKLAELLNNILSLS